MSFTCDAWAILLPYNKNLMFIRVRVFFFVFLFLWAMFHKGSAVGNHLREQHDLEPDDIPQSLRILTKCQNTFDCLISKCFFIKDLKPTLNSLIPSVRNYSVFRSLDKSLLLLITLWLLFVNFYNYFITYVTYFYCFLVIVVFFNYFLTATKVFMRIAFTF